MKLTTVNVYNVLIQAQVARNALESAGIWAVLQDADFVGNFGLYSNMIGGVKLQVRDIDAERALELLRDFQHDRGTIDEEELTRQALEAAHDPENELDEDEVESVETAAEDPPDLIHHPPPLQERESYAFRFLRMTVFNFFLPLLTPYAIYLLLNAAFGSGPITSTGRWRIATGIVFLLLQPLFWFYLYLLAVFTS